MGNARADLNTFCQRLKASPPTYLCEDVDGGFCCTLALPRIEQGDVIFEPEAFKGEARTKKAACQNAAENALNLIKEHPVYQSHQQPESIWKVLQKFHDKGFYKDPEFEGYVMLARESDNNSLPVHLFQLSRPVQKWAAQHMPDAHSPQDFMTQFREHLQQTPMDSSVGGVLELDGNCFRVRPATTGKRKELDVTALDVFTETLKGHSIPWTAVTIPADSSAKIEEVELTGGQHYLDSIAAIVGGQMEDVVVWGRINKPKTVYICKDRELSQPVAAPDELWSQKRLKSSSSESSYSRTRSAENPAWSSDASITNPRTSLREPTGKTTENDSPLGQIEKLEGRPAGYSIYNPLEFNVRASALLGKEVHGDLILSNCRLRANEQRFPVMIWDHFTIDQFWAWAGTMLPSYEYAASTQMPQLAQLPTRFGSTRSFSGMSPCNLLSSYVSDIQYNTHESSSAQDRDPDNGITNVDAVNGGSPPLKKLGQPPGTSWGCEVRARVPGFPTDCVAGFLRTDLSAQATNCDVEEFAKQEAALKLLHAYESWMVTLFQADFLAHTERSSQDFFTSSSADDTRNGNSKEQPGAIVKFNFRVIAKEGSISGSVLSEGQAKLQFNTGAVLPEVHQMLLDMKPGESKTQSMRLRLNGPNPFSRLAAVCEVQLTTDQQSPQPAPPPPRAHNGGQNGAGPHQQQSLFEPSMSKQRHQKIAEIFGRHEVTEVLDIGCGAVKLVEHLLNEALDKKGSIRKVVGIDIDGQAVERGLRKLLKHSELLAERQPCVELYQGNVACPAAAAPGAWGGYTGIQAAVFQEVIEHLDPEPLSHVASCLLGSLQPKLLVLSTPNIEYNQVLNCLDSQLLPNGLRNSDHRFEWTRGEFEAWCNQAASDYGYSVSCEGLGHAKDEVPALESLNLSNLGASTQVATFSRKSSQTPSPGAGQEAVFTNLLFSSTTRNAELRQELLGAN